MLEEVTQPNHKSFTAPQLSTCQKPHTDSIMIFKNYILKKTKPKPKKNLSNGGLSVACFKCKPACLEHLHRSSDSMLKLEDWSICQRQKTSLVLIWKQAKVDLKQVKWSHPGSTHVPRFLLQTKSIIENQFSASFGCLRALWRGFVHLVEPGFPSGPEVVLDFYRCRTAARRPLSSGENCLPWCLQLASAESYFYNLYYFI